MAIKQHFNRISWMEWPDEAIRMRVPEAMARYERLLREDIQYFEFLQFLFRSQWQRLHDYAKLHDKRRCCCCFRFVCATACSGFRHAEYAYFQP